jgi:hypothetical protein
MQPVPGTLRTVNKPPLASTLRLEMSSATSSPERSAPLCAKWQKHCLHGAGWQTAASILHFDQNPIVQSVSTQPNLGGVPGEFEGVLEKIADGGGEHLRLRAPADPLIISQIVPAFSI